MKRWRVGVIGVGHLGNYHTSKYRELESRTQLVGVFDADPERAAEIAGKHQTKAFQSSEELLKNVEAVTIATPTAFHKDMVTQALDLGVHVLVEKPLALDASEAQSLVSLSREKDRVLAVGHIERFNPVWQTLASNLDHLHGFHARRLTEEKDRGRDIDVIADLMVHDIDLALQLSGRQIPEVLIASGAGLRSSDIDCVWTCLRFPSFVAYLEAHRMSGTPLRCWTFMSKNQVWECDLVGFHVESIGKERASLKIGRQDALKQEVQAFLDRLDGQSNHLATGQEGLEVLEVADKVRGLSLG